MWTYGWGERELLSLQGSILGVAIQLSFNPGTKAVCSESPDRTELRDTHEALFPNQSVFWSKHLSDGNVNLLMCLLVSFPLYSSCCGHLSELRVTLVSEAEQTSGLTWCAASETVISSSFWETGCWACEGACWSPAFSKEIWNDFVYYWFLPYVLKLELSSSTTQDVTVI